MTIVKRICAAIGFLCAFLAAGMEDYAVRRGMPMRETTIVLIAAACLLMGAFVLISNAQERRKGR